MNVRHMVTLWIRRPCSAIICDKNGEAKILVVYETDLKVFTGNQTQEANKCRKN